MAKKKRIGLWVTVGILGFVVLLLVGSLVFVEVTIRNLDSTLDERQVEVVAAYEARTEAVNKLVSRIKPKMDLDADAFKTLESAEKLLKDANDVKSRSEANLEVDKAIDNLVFVMLDKYMYLNTPEVIEIESEIDTARSRIVLATTNFNDVAKEYNFAVENFPGNGVPFACQVGQGHSTGLVMEQDRHLAVFPPAGDADKACFVPGFLAEDLSPGDGREFLPGPDQGLVPPAHIPVLAVFLPQHSPAAVRVL